MSKTPSQSTRERRVLHFTGERPQLTEYERAYCGMKTQAAFMLISALDDHTLLEGAYQREPVFSELIRVLGEKTNHSWIMARCVEEAYERGLMDERELDYLTR